ncbi:hypothetical protein [Lentibacillus sp. JNUCC-1]|uniref:hypothetical protein n=1 Tax=Lentibacillus sp. JNUCC-1 TaxID=2654513 RepID=UPI001E347646|nr:hypothetical protein [Lentibacillus sp. JNUCC-1]
MPVFLVMGVLFLAVILGWATRKSNIKHAPKVEVLIYGAVAVLFVGLWMIQ